MTEPNNAIESNSLHKVYKRSNNNITALQNFNLKIPRGSFFGLLGPNGAGKSTFINILAGLTNKTSGDARIWGYDLDKDTRNARLSIGVVPQELVLDPYFTAREALEAQAGYFGLRKNERRTSNILETVGLTDQAETYPRALSGGMRRRLMVAKALVHNPPVVVLDEPTAGVDVELRQQLWSHLRHLNSEGTSIVLTTHYLEEAEALCDHIAIINEGVLIACESTAQLIERLDMKEIIISSQAELLKLPSSLERLGAKLISSKQISIKFRQKELNIEKLLDITKNDGIVISDLTTKEPDLEDIFLHLTQKNY